MSLRPNLIAFFFRLALGQAILHPARDAIQYTNTFLQSDAHTGKVTVSDATYPAKSK